VHCVAWISVSLGYSLGSPSTRTFPKRRSYSSADSIGVLPGQRLAISLRRNAASGLGNALMPIPGPATLMGYSHDEELSGMQLVNDAEWETL
jgi:hypothetical protein